MYICMYKLFLRDVQGPSHTVHAASGPMASGCGRLLRVSSHPAVAALGAVVVCFGGGSCVLRTWAGGCAGPLGTTHVGRRISGLALGRVALWRLTERPSAVIPSVDMTVGVAVFSQCLQQRLSRFAPCGSLPSFFFVALHATRHMTHQRRCRLPG